MTWEQGQSGNPKGRPKNTANRILTKALQHALGTSQDGHRKLDDLIGILVSTAMDPKHPHYLGCVRLVFSRLQAELRHEMTKEEADNASILLDALMSIASRSDREPSDTLGTAAE